MFCLNTQPIGLNTLIGEPHNCLHISTSDYVWHDMSQANGSQTLTTPSRTKQSQEVLHQLLEKLGHLDLTGKLSTEDGIVQAAHGGNGDIYVTFC